MGIVPAQIKNERPRPMNKEDKEYWRDKTKRLINAKRSDLEAVFESDIQKMKDKKWNSFLKSLNLNPLLARYNKSSKIYNDFRDSKNKVERELRNKVEKDYQAICDKIDRFTKIRQWEDNFEVSFDDGEVNQSDKVIKYLSDQCYDECKKMFNRTKKAQSLNELEDTQELLNDALHINNSDPRILGLIKAHLQKVGITNLGILSVDINKYKQIGQ